MRIIVVGGTGLIGKAVVQELSSRHDVHTASHKDTALMVDITDINSIKSFFEKAGSFDALVATTGQVVFADFADFNQEKYMIGLQDKLMGQVNLVLEGFKHIECRGSFTLTSGILSRDPIKMGSSAAMVNGALESFVRSVAIEMPRGIRINCISPTVVTESLPNYGPYFRGFESTPVAKVALAYSKSVEGAQTGQVYFV